DAGHDGQGRTARQDPRPARTDAQPEVGHRHQRRRSGRARGERRQGRVPDRQIRHRPRADRQGLFRLASAQPEPDHAGRRFDPQQAGHVEGSVHPDVLPALDPGPVGPGRRPRSGEAARSRLSSRPMYGPVIEGKLLRLRPPRPEDAVAMTSWFEDLEVTRFLNLQNPPSLEMEKEWIESNAKDPTSIVWVIEVEGRAVGSTGIRAIDWKQGHGITGTVISDKTLWGKGIGGELMQLRASYLFNHTPLRKLKSAFMDGNVASGRAQASA